MIYPSVNLGGKSQNEGASVGADIVENVRKSLGGDEDAERMIDNVRGLFKADGPGFLEVRIRVSEMHQDYAGTTVSVPCMSQCPAPELE